MIIIDVTGRNAGLRKKCTQMYKIKGLGSQNQANAIINRRFRGYGAGQRRSSQA